MFSRHLKTLNNIAKFASVAVLFLKKCINFFYILCKSVQNISSADSVLYRKTSLNPLPVKIDLRWDRDRFFAILETKFFNFVDTCSEKTKKSIWIPAIKFL